MTRREDWGVRFHAAIKAALHRPFEWGVHDCAIFAANIIQEMTDEDVAEPWRGYADERGAVRMALKAGGLSGIATSVLGEPIKTTFAQCGDIVLIASDRVGWDGSLAVCAGVKAACVAEDGLIFVKREKWLQAWRVG